MAFDENLAQRVRDQLGRTTNIEEKRMFGGVAFLLNGNMLVGVLKDELIVRLGPESWAEALHESHVRAFAVTGRAMKGWVLVEPDEIDEERQLADWIERARAFVETLPAK
jgi:TfoX/Sxy family transcriptional regulator of competence genes